MFCGIGFVDHQRFSGTLRLSFDPHDNFWAERSTSFSVQSGLRGRG